MNTWWKSRELRYALATADTKVLVMVDSYLSNDYAAALGSDLDALRADVPTLQTIVNIGEHRPAYLPFRELVAAGRAADAGADIDAASPDRVAYLLFTSGSTARPKAVPIFQGKMLANGFEIGVRMGMTEADRTLFPISLFWSYACMNGMLTTMTHGGTVVLQNRFEASETLAIIERERCSVLYATPNITLALLQHPDRPKRDISSLRKGTAQPASARLMIELGATEACTIYALTECGIVTVSDHRLPLAERLRSSGTTLPGMELEVVDSTTRAVLPRNATGEVRVRSYMTPGYYKDAAQTAQAFDAEGWCYTGDVGFLDDTGAVHITGRQKDIIKSGGINIAPAEVENLLVACPGVAQAIVVGVPDPERTEVIAALIVPKPGAQLDEQAVARYCRAEAAAYKAPRIMRFVSFAEVPVTQTGKVDRKAVQRLFDEQRNPA
jgi:fatty-acyl-CoA synthase